MNYYSCFHLQTQIHVHIRYVRWVMALMTTKVQPSNALELKTMLAGTNISKDPLFGMVGRSFLLKLNLYGSWFWQPTSYLKSIGI